MVPALHSRGKSGNARVINSPLALLHVTAAALRKAQHTTSQGTNHVLKTLESPTPHFWALMSEWDIGDTQRQSLMGAYTEALDQAGFENLFKEQGSGSAVYLPMQSAWISPAPGREEGNHNGLTGLEGREDSGKSNLVNLVK